MTHESPPLFIIDVDWVITDCGTPPRARPGLQVWLGSLSAIGEVHLWSGGGKQHCEEVAAELDIQDYVTASHAKPDYPPTEREALEILGRKPALQVDDDPTERVADWPFLAVDAFTVDSDGL